jgi:hypothetical protein
MYMYYLLPILCRDWVVSTPAFNSEDQAFCLVVVCGGKL